MGPTEALTPLESNSSPFVNPKGINAITITRNYRNDDLRIFIINYSPTMIPVPIIDLQEEAGITFLHNS